MNPVIFILLSFQDVCQTLPPINESHENQQNLTDTA